MLHVTRTALVAATLLMFATGASAATRFNISYPADMSTEPLMGRIILVVAPAASETEPRLQVIWDQDAVPFFGIDVHDWKAGERRVIDRKSFGFPLRSIDDLQPGDYRVQAVLNRYEKFTLGDGRQLELAPDQGEG